MNLFRAGAALPVLAWPPQEARADDEPADSVAALD
jgi:hypothetical protein